ncbi:MAG: dihydroxy-acid dehydratase, partial [Candidatus Poribacteria bacterium]|nr:dihydroxy-acid dehydratase [Candidatus Poribacteria bacterium]
MPNLKHRSHNITDRPSRSPARAMLHAVGLTDADLDKPIIGIANTWTELGPCNFHLRRLAEKVKEGVRAAGGTPLEFNTIVVSDGISMGTEGMKASLVSREVIADSIELTALGHSLDAVVALSGCDKTIPGTVMALRRLNLPSVMLYGGSIAPGVVRGQDMTIQNVFEAVGALAAGRMDEGHFIEIEQGACPAAGACGGQFTANTMAMACEILGISPIGSGSVPAMDPLKDEVAAQVGKLVMEVLESGRTPDKIITRESIENAIAAVAMSGGSTNAVLHLLAIANEGGIELHIDDFDRISSATPLLCDLKPGGKYVANDLFEAGGIPVVAKRLLDGGYLHA